jgi:cytoskeletal protein RodZ
MPKTSRYKTNVRNKSGSRKRLYWFGFIVILIIIVVLLVLQATGTTHFFRKTVPAVIPVTKVQSTRKGSKKTSTSTAQPATSDTTQSTKSTAPSSTTQSAALVAPYGTFVSNHTPGQNGSPTEETSTCGTTPGASCYIKFTNTSNGTTTVLPTQTVTSSGSTSWTWNCDILTTGSWQVVAVATLDGKTLTTQDPRTMEVQ